MKYITEKEKVKLLKILKLEEFELSIHDISKKAVSWDRFPKSILDMIEDIMYNGKKVIIKEFK